MVTFRFARKCLCIHSIRIAGHLHKLLVWYICSAEQQKASRHSFLTNGADFDAVAVMHDGDNRNHADFDEVDLFGWLVWLVDYLLEPKFEIFKVWADAIKGRLRKLCQNCVL